MIHFLEGLCHLRDLRIYLLRLAQELLPHLYRYIVEKKEIPEIKKDMIKEALSLYKEIFPPSVHKTIDECFTYEEDKILLWFNTSDLSTKIVQRDIPS